MNGSIKLRQKYPDAYCVQLRKENARKYGEFFAVYHDPDCDRRDRLLLGMGMSPEDAWRDADNTVEQMHGIRTMEGFTYERG